MLAGLREQYPQASLAVNQIILLVDREGTTVSELARRAGVTKQAMAESVAILESTGLVIRVPDPTDRRARRVQLSEEGWQAARDGWRVAQAIHARWEQLLGDADMARLVGLLERLADLLDEAADE